jgi:hypothetical protein
MEETERFCPPHLTVTTIKSPEVLAEGKACEIELAPEPTDVSACCTSVIGEGDTGEAGAAG